MLPAAILASPPALWGMIVGLALASGRGSSEVGFGVGVGEGMVGGQGSS